MNVVIFVGDSTQANPPPAGYDLVFVDGDHSYHGGKKDFHTWRGALKPGGHMLFHDSVFAGPKRSFSKELVTLMSEIEQEFSAELDKVDEVGTITHFQRKS